MAYKSCHWFYTILECCGLRRQDKSTEETGRDSISEEEAAGDSLRVTNSVDKKDLIVSTDALHSAYAVVSVSCPAIADSTPPVRSLKDDHRGPKHPSSKGKPRIEPQIHQQRLSSDSRINSQLKAPTAATEVTPPTFNPPAGDGKHSDPAQNRGDVESTVESCTVPDGELNNREMAIEMVSDEGENCTLNAGEIVPPQPKDVKPQEDPKVQGVEDLSRFTSPANQPRRRSNATIIVYHVTVADRNRDLFNGFKQNESNDVEMLDLSNQPEDVEMADLTAEGCGGTYSEGAARTCGTQSVEVVATIEHALSTGSAALKSGDFSSSFNVVASMRYIPKLGGEMRSCSETSVCLGRGQDPAGSENSKEAVVVIGDPECRRTILWNEAVKVIYFDKSSKLRKSASSGEGQQDLLAWEIVPLKDAPRGSRTKWAKAVKSGFIRSDLCSVKSSERSSQSDDDSRRDGSEASEDGRSTLSTSSSSATTSEEN